MIIKQLIDEDFLNYKRPAMVIGFPYCSFKCDKECGMKICQNSELSTAPDIEIDVTNIVDRYLDNPITEAIVCQGLEPIDSLDDILDLLNELSWRGCTDDFVIYTGYTKEEIEEKVPTLSEWYPNIIIKYGRFIPNQDSHYDEVLGVYLVSDNQYAEKIGGNNNGNT